MILETNIRLDTGFSFIGQGIIENKTLSNLKKTHFKWIYPDLSMKNQICDSNYNNPIM